MRRTFALCLLLAADGPAAAADYPHFYLTHGRIKAKVYAPDPAKGFYRGTRFCRAGVVGEIEVNGHKYFGPWKDAHDPTNHDDIVGPVWEFGNEEPLGYAEAKPGETFLKIGVGELEKPDDAKYSFARKYQVVKPAPWKRVQKEEAYVEWETSQKLANGYGYQLRVSVRVIDNEDEPRMYLNTHLKNVGTKPFTTDVYNHNFFNVDGDPVGPNYSIGFNYQPKPANIRDRFAELVDVSNKTVRFRKPLDTGTVFASLPGWGPDKTHTTFQLRHAPSKTRIDVLNGGGAPLAKMNLWAIKTALCPEPYFAYTIEPGATRGPGARYHFLQDEKK
jgi:hypothetical protein